jgi:hypothetical protein
MTGIISIQHHKNLNDNLNKQIKVSVPADVASGFKAACAASNISMTSTLTHFMADYSKMTYTKKKLSPDYSTKRQRRAAIHKSILQLEQIRDCEEQYRNRIPENLQGSAAYENAEEFITCLDSAIDALEPIDSI